MKLSVSLPAEDVEFLDQYARSLGARSRSAVIRRAVRLLRASELALPAQCNELAFPAWRSEPVLPAGCSKLASPVGRSERALPAEPGPVTRTASTEATRTERYSVRRAERVRRRCVGTANEHTGRYGHLRARHRPAKGGPQHPLLPTKSRGEGIDKNGLLAADRQLATAQEYRETNLASDPSQRWNAGCGSPHVHEQTGGSR